MKKKFGALRSIGSIYKGLALAVFIVGFIPAFLSFILGMIGGRERGIVGTFGGGTTGAITAVAILLGILLITLMLYGAGEAIFLAIDVEENTRSAAEALTGMSQKWSSTNTVHPSEDGG